MANASLRCDAMNRFDEMETARKILAACGFDAAEVAPLARFNNPVFRCQLPGGSRILKICKSLDGAAPRKELALIEHLSLHGIPAPDVERADPAGELVGRPFILMRSSGDQTVADLLGPSEIARNLLFEMGAVLARIHQTPTAELHSHATDRISAQGVETYLGSLADAADALAAQRLLEVAEVNRFRALPMPAAGGESLCHSDFHAVQCVVNDDRIAAVVDWESAWIGNPAIDLAISHAYLDFYCPRALTRAFLSGYLSAHTIPDDYGQAYLPVRMAQVLGMLRAWYTRGEEAWQSALAQQKVARAIRLFRLYAERFAG